VIQLVEVFELFKFHTSLIFFSTSPQRVFSRSTHRQHFDLLLTAWLVGSTSRLHLVDELDISQHRIIVLKFGQHHRVLRALRDWLLLLDSSEEDVGDWLLLVWCRLGRHRQSLNLHLNQVAILVHWGGLWLVHCGREHNRLQHFRRLSATVAKGELADRWTWFHLGKSAYLLVWKCAVILFLRVWQFELHVGLGANSYVCRSCVVVVFLVGVVCGSFEVAAGGLDTKLEIAVDLLLLPSHLIE